MSLGLALWEVDDEGMPVRLLNAQTVLHDGGVHRGMEKTATTRRAAGGTARRTRRLYRRRRRRLAAVDAVLTEHGYPETRTRKDKDPRAPWRIRARLADEHIADEAERRRLIAVAVRHIARHRGWRNPYLRVETFRSPQRVSAPFCELLVRLGEATDTTAAVSDDRTVGQVVAHSIAAWADTQGKPVGPKLRTGKGTVKGAMVVRLNQSDLANELHRIFDVQRVDADEAWSIIEAVFAAESPRGAWRGRIGRDPLPGQRTKPRASKADPAFQEFRALAVIANLRIGREERPLTAGERGLVADMLLGWTDEDAPTWSDVADALGIERRALKGTATAGIDGEPTTRPPVDATMRAIRESKLPRSVKEWWLGASPGERAALVDVLAGDADVNDTTPEDAAVDELLSSLPPDDIDKLEAVSLPAGRAAYSRHSLQRISARLRSTEEDLHVARREEFNLPDTWRPPVEAINAPLGNGAVDRVTKALGRWLLAVEREWGAPDRIVIEHVRDAFLSVEAAREHERETESRRRTAERTRERMAAEGLPSGTSTGFGQFQVRRYLAVERQNSQCLYCGAEIGYLTSELDHIVPRKGEGGGRSTEDNLVAVCRECNRSKSNTPFAVWAASAGRPGVSIEAAVDRVRHWSPPAGMPFGEFRSFRTRVIQRLKRTEDDEPIDDRAMESVAWMAREVASRIRAHFGDKTEVFVFRGAVTAEARKAAGIDKQFRMLGGEGKQRFDRRHHVIDAAVVALMRPGVAQVLAQRIALREKEWIASDTSTPIETRWREFYGAESELFLRWKEQMAAAVEVLQKALDDDAIVVTNPLRLSAKVGRLHDDTVSKLTRVRLGEEMSVELIDRAATPALWHALTRHEDFDPVRGLPAARQRRIRVNGTWYDENDEVEFFPGDAAALRVQKGWAKLGAVHHGRIYRFDVRGKSTFGMVRVFAADAARLRGSDLFAVDLDPGTISMRVTEPRTRRALAAGDADYLGFIVPGDEFEIDADTASVRKLVELKAEFSPIYRWEITGFVDPAKLSVRPLQLSKEDVPEDVPDVVRDVVDRWRPSVDVLVGLPGFRVIRRDALGRDRVVSAAHLPTCWSPGD